MKLRISGVVRESIVDGRGLRFVVFCQGCPHHCPGCHNPATHDFEAGTDVDIQRIVEEVAKNPMLQGVTFSGGEPFCQAAAFAELGQALKALPGRRLDRSFLPVHASLPNWRGSRFEIWCFFPEKPQSGR